MVHAAVQQLPTIFTHADAMTAGISNRALYEMRDSGEIERVARGIYAKPQTGADYNLVEIATRSLQATLCLTSALAHHDLTDDIPPSINVALPRSARQPKTEAPVTWHRFDASTFDVGRDTHPLTDQLAIAIYSPERSIIDAYRLRHLYGIDQAHEALKRWLRVRSNQPSALLAMAKHFPKAQPIIRTTLETLL